jgi:hypothetical protein
MIVKSSIASFMSEKTIIDTIVMYYHWSPKTLECCNKVELHPNSMCNNE